MRERRKFNLEQALAGKPVVTRDGQEVTSLIYGDREGNYPVRGIVDGKIHTWTINGTYSIGYYYSHSYDLFMESTVKVGWGFRFRTGISCSIYDTEEEAEQAGKKYYPNDFKGVARIEWEE